jgi:hypothetical protein
MLSAKSMLSKPGVLTFMVADGAMAVAPIWNCLPGTSVIAAGL